MYDAGNLLMELDGLDRNGDGQPDNAPLTQFTWGLDLSGQNGNASNSASRGVLAPGSDLGGVGVSPAGLHAAGGIGGLLAMTDTKGTPSELDDVHLVYFYDANGNIGQLVNADSPLASIQARYEYYPFGGILYTWSTGSGNANPFRFSTKYRDAEKGRAVPWQAQNVDRLPVRFEEGNNRQSGER